MSDIKSPEASLTSYFDELLHDSEEQQALAQLAGTPLVSAQLVAGLARVVPLPIRPDLLGKGELKTPNLVAVSQRHELDSPPVANLPVPELAQEFEQKQKLERMLQAARTQMLLEAKPAALTSAKADVDVEDVDTELARAAPTAFKQDPGEIQDWDIAPQQPEIAPIAVTAAPETGGEIFQLPGLEWYANGRPVWAQSRFEVLLFSVSGLTLAVPLIALGQIQPLTDELTPLFGQADWFMGLQPTPAGKIRTVNTAKFVMPERYDERFVQSAKYVVSIDGVPWGLAVDSVNQPITLEPDDVKWRSDRSKRPWLAGTVKEHMCALLDIPRIGQMLIEADRNFNVR